MTLFCIPGPDDQNRWNRKNCPKFFHRVIFAFWIQICNPNLCKSHIFWITANIWEMIFFCIPGPDDQNRWNRKNCLKFFHRVIFAFWIQICNPNLCKSHTFWNTANIEKLPFFAWWPKLMKKEKLPATQIYVNPIHFEIQLILRNYLFSHDDQNWWKKKNCPKFFHGVILAL